MQTKLNLVAAAIRARTRAVAPYSGFRVGAALLTAKGEIVAGANVESASYGLTCCAERVALFNALTQSARSFLAIAVVARMPGGPTPCGACRQLLAEYAPDAVVWVADSARPGRIRTFSVRQLLPDAFTKVPPATARRATSVSLGGHSQATARRPGRAEPKRSSRRGPKPQGGRPQGASGRALHP